MGPSRQRQVTAAVLAAGLVLVLASCTPAPIQPETKTVVTPAQPSPVARLLPLAEGGDAVAQYQIGLLYDQGTTVAKNPAKALRWYRHAADQGHALALNNLGVMHERGIGLVQNYAEALTFFRRAAEKNNAIAMNNLGIMYREGRGVRADASEALGWFTRAADQGLAAAQANLAAAHANGSGTTRSDVRAYFWYTLSAARGSGDQATRAAEHRDIVGRRLDPETVAKLQTAAKSWMTGTGEASIAALVALGGSGRAPASSGTGFVVSRSGHILTSAHVVRSCGSITARRGGEAEKIVTIVAVDRANDLALLRGDIGGGDVAVFRSTPQLRPGDGVVTYGFPLSSTLATDGNLTTGTVSALSGVKDDARMIQFSAPIQRGNSGGALLDLSGHVLGVIASKLDPVNVAQRTVDVPQNVNFAIRASLAQSFLEANGVEIRRAVSSSRLDAADIGERARRFTARVDCRG
ncbi:MAG: trypsin-like serine protease [Alphaproteobacteria bacterium]|nr:trypsin-like serine protease [Alphaproteobacteria bacterium]